MRATKTHLLRMCAMLAVALIMSGCVSSLDLDKRHWARGIVENYEHLRSTGEVASLWSHLAPATSFSRDFAIYSDIGSSEKGVVAAGETIFLEVLGPWSFGDLNDLWDLLSQ